ncbi:MAG TPA: AIR synthase-related protein, partial [Abditibacteriaceae bacterium]
MSDSMLQKALALGMNEGEYNKVLEILDREPTATELAMYSVEWSEHCGYPRSRSLLRLLPKDGHYASIAGADAGGIEIEPNLTIVFKMESHNHPSQVEPRQGAATGIGGIVRDIFTVGARPIACLDSLRFGTLDEARARYLLAGVVDGISFYGNCLGIPTVAGEVGFNASYRGNCLVGAMAVGVVDSDKIASGAAAGAGNAVMYFGNATGRDGIGGCSILASHDMTDTAARPTVQVGDPFAEKCLIEACLEALPTGAIVSMKDMGAAGLTCTTCEQAAAGGMGMDIDLNMVPLRESGMEAYEIMMSESQERMLAVVEAGREAEVAEIFQRWGAHAVVLGRVTDDGILRVRVGDQVVAEMTAQSLADAPLYDLPWEE